jgi:preprotein translocase subunit YajC
LNLIDLLLQASPPATVPGEQAPGFAVFLRQFFPIILIIFIFYIFFFRRSQTEKKKRVAMLSELKRGDKVQTIGGILGNVVEAREDRVQLKVDESSNTKMWFARSAIARVLDDDKADAK